MSDSIVNSVPTYYSDPKNLQALAQSKDVGKDAKLKEIGVQFEAMMVRELLSDALKPMLESMFKAGTPGGNVYKDMILDNFSQHIARANQIGVSSFYQQEMGEMMEQMGYKDDGSLEKPIELAPEVRHSGEEKASAEPSQEAKAQSPSLSSIRQVSGS